jgi:tRNA (cmo5U34)-methyltransferase
MTEQTRRPRTAETGGWAFDEEVSHVFDDMLRRSIPQYGIMRGLVYEVGRAFVQPGTAVVDLGCSRGEAVAPFVEEFGADVRFVGVEVSPPMREACRERFAAEIEAGTFELLDLDLRERYPDVAASLTLSVLTMQFTPIEYRHGLVQDVFDRTVPGGALVLVEKVLGRSAQTETLLTGLYHTLKRANGYAQEEIDRKRLQLEGVLVPVTAAWNEELLRTAGFGVVECFWRYLNFAAWVAVRDPRA